MYILTRSRVIIYNLKIHYIRNENREEEIIINNIKYEKLNEEYNLSLIRTEIELKYKNRTTELDSVNEKSNVNTSNTSNQYITKSHHIKYFKMVMVLSNQNLYITQIGVMILLCEK